MAATMSNTDFMIAIMPRSTLHPCARPRAGLCERHLCTCRWGVCRPARGRPDARASRLKAWGARPLTRAEGLLLLFAVALWAAVAVGMR